MFKFKLIEIFSGLSGLELQNGFAMKLTKLVAFECHVTRVAIGYDGIRLNSNGRFLSNK